MSRNLVKTGFLLALLTGILVAAGALVGSTEGMIIAFLVALAMNAFSYWNSDAVVLRMFKAQPLAPDAVPQLYDVVAKLSERAGLPMPKVYMIDSPQPNAFATGRNPANAAVCVSRGLLETLSIEEIAGVLGHELAHVKNRDTLTMTIAATMAGAISTFANILQFSVLFGGRRPNSRGGWLGLFAAALVAPFAAGLVQMAISRSREYDADREGARLCGNPHWLASALAKIQVAVRGQPAGTTLEIPSAAHLFIVNPLTGNAFDSWFMTHPDTRNRIAELERLAAEWEHDRAHAPAPIAIGGTASDSRRMAGGSPRGPWG